MSPPSARWRRCSPTGSVFPVRRGAVRSRRRALGRQGPTRSLRSGIEIPLPVRIVHVARDAAFQRMLGGDEFAARVIRERAGHAFDPAVAAMLADEAADILALDADASAWDETLACEPRPRLTSRARRSTGPWRRWVTSPISSRRTSSVTPREWRRWRPRRPSGVAWRRPTSSLIRRAGARPRPGTGRGSGPDLAEAGAADAGRVGAGEAASVLHGARAHALSVPVGARAGREQPPRATRRFGLSPRIGRRRR